MGIFTTKGRTAALVLGMALLMGGCAGEDDSPAAESEIDPQQSPTSSAESVEEVLAELAKLPPEERLAEMEAQAAKEGRALMYGESNLEMQQSWVEAFNEQYPDVTMMQFRQKPENLIPRIEAEARAGEHLVDVIFVNSVEGAALVDAGLVAKHGRAPIPEAIPDRYIDEYSIVQYINPNVIAWNTNLVSDDEAPTGLDDLLDPKWKGKVEIDVGPLTFVAGLVHARGEDGAREYLEALVVDNEARVSAGHTAKTNRLAAGEFPIAVELYAYRVESMMDEGAPIDYIAPDPAASGAESIYIYKDTKHPYAAALVAHWLLSEEGGQVTADSGRVHVNPNVTLAYPALTAFLQEGTPEWDRSVIITPEIADETNDIARDLVEEIIIPRLSE